MKVKITATPEQLTSIGIDDHSIIGGEFEVTKKYWTGYWQILINHKLPVTGLELAITYDIKKQWLTEVKDKT